MILENIEVLLELTRWKKQAMLTHGGTKLFNKAVNAGKAIYKGARLSKEAIGKLKDAGVVKSHADWSAGMNKGSENMVKKYGTRFEKYNPSEGAHFNQTTNSIHAGDNPRQKRHEAREAVEYHKNPKLPQSRIYDKLGRIGNHWSPKVLQDEKKHTDTLKTIYPDKLNKDDISSIKFRKKHGEYKPFVQNLKNKDIINFDRLRNKSYNDEIQKLKNAKTRNASRQKKVWDMMYNAATVAKNKPVEHDVNIKKYDQNALDRAKSLTSKIEDIEKKNSEDNKPISQRTLDLKSRKLKAKKILYAIKDKLNDRGPKLNYKLKSLDLERISNVHSKLLDKDMDINKKIMKTNKPSGNIEINTHTKKLS